MPLEYAIKSSPGMRRACSSAKDRFRFSLLVGIDLYRLNGIAAEIMNSLHTSTDLFVRAADRVVVHSPEGLRNILWASRPCLNDSS